MKITSIKTFMTNEGVRSRALVKVETDKGIHGWGEAYSPGPDRAIEPVLDYIFEMIQGEDPRRIEYIMMKLFQQFRFPPGAIGLSAMSGLDHALWDISGKAAGLPVYMLLGGAVRDRIQVYRSIRGKTTGDIVAEAKSLNRKWGFTVFKTSPYRIDPEKNRWGRVCQEASDFFSGLRLETPDDWEYAFDAHAKIFEPIRALQMAEALAPYDPYFYEEPLRPENSDAWARLRSQMNVPLATGECLFTRFEFLDLLSRHGADIIQPDVCVCGGLLELRKIAAIAEAHYVTVAPHNPMGPIATAVNVHFAASSPNFKILEYHLPDDTTAGNWVVDPYLPRNGHLELRPDLPGLGIEVNEDEILKHGYVHWQRTAPIRKDGSTAYI